MAKIVMTNEQLIQRLKMLTERKTGYSNKYPYNLLYVHKDKTTADCVNLYKALFNGYNIYNNTVGYYQRDLSNTGDITESQMISKCTEVSTDFTKLKDNHFRILYMRGHIGGYIPAVVRDGKEYNVIEATKSFGGGIVYSWVDSDGTRRKYKGGTKNGKWEKHGKPTLWISYPNATEGSNSGENAQDDKTTAQKVYFVKKGDTLSSIAKTNKLTLAKLISYNPQIKNINKISIGQKIYLSADVKEEYYIVKSGDTLNSIARKFNMSLATLLGLNPDIKNPNLIRVNDKIRIK